MVPNAFENTDKLNKFHFQVYLWFQKASNGVRYQEKQSGKHQNFLSQAKWIEDTCDEQT